jgi:hypothetical protein
MLSISFHVPPHSPTTDTHHLARLIKLKHFGAMEDFVTTFEHFDFRMDGMSNSFFKELFINGLKDEIFPQVLMSQPQTWFESTKCTKEAQ